MPIDEAYFVWLYSQVGSVETVNLSVTYWKLLKMLHEKEFTWSPKIKNDENRAKDGKDLRLEFLRVTNTEMDDQQWMDYPCSMLELLVALSRKLEYQDDGSLAGWFWHLIENLGLAQYTDAPDPPDEETVDSVLDIVIHREYDWDGVGGLFPLREMNNQPDQRDVEIWRQAQAYLLERF